MYAYIGAFSYEGEGGIHICNYDEESGTFAYQKTVRPEINAGFVTMRGNHLYVTDERAGKPGSFPQAGGGRVYLFEADRETGDLTEISCTDTLGVNPSHVTFDETGRYAIVTHFSIGPMVTKVKRTETGFRAVPVGNDSVTCLFRVEENGAPGKLADVYWHEDGAGPMSMIHKAYRKPGENLYAENDLGADRIYFFSIDYETETLKYHGSEPAGQGGAGPRHGVYHPYLPCLYINYERKGAVTCFDVSDSSGMKMKQDLCFVPEGMELDRRRDNQSELMFSADGKILYSFLRGKGYAVVFRVDETSGMLSLLQFLKLPGADPRGASFSPDHKFILIAGHEAGEVETLEVLRDGTLKDSGKRCGMKNPASITFFRGNLS